MAKPIPEGHRSVTPHLTVRGAARAIDFYRRAFGAEEVMRMPSRDGTKLTPRWAAGARGPAEVVSAEPPPPARRTCGSAGGERGA